MTEALLFRIVRLTWERQLSRLTPILNRPGPCHAAKLRDFLREFFLIEAAEADLRRALRAASVELRDTAAYGELIAKGVELTRAFMAAAVAHRTSGELDFITRFTVMLTTSFAERTTDERTTGADLIRQADLLSNMLAAQFGIT